MRRKIISLLGVVAVLAVAVILTPSVAPAPSSATGLYQEDEYLYNPEYMALLEEKAKHVDQVMEDLGKTFRDGVTVANRRVIIAYVDGEPVSLNEYHYFMNHYRERARVREIAPPSPGKIWDYIVVERFAVAAEARAQGLYPSETYMDQYVEKNKQVYASPEAANVKAETDSLIKGWGVSLDDYYLIVRDIWTVSAAKMNWGETFAEQFRQLESAADQAEGQGQSDREIWQAVYGKELERLRQNAEVTITAEGAKLGLAWPIVEDRVGLETEEQRR